jgi:hypothetical protein
MNTFYFFYFSLSVRHLAYQLQAKTCANEHMKQTLITETAPHLGVSTIVQNYTGSVQNHFFNAQLLHCSLAT